MADYAHEETEKELAELEARIAQVYTQAAAEMKDTVESYFERLEERVEKEQARVDAGEISEEQFQQWEQNQIGRGKRFEAMRDKLAERYTNANEVAISYVNDAIPDVYSLNRNYSAYEIESVGAGVDFTLWDEATVRKMIVEDPDTMPYYPEKKAVARGIDLAYGKQQINASITSGILQGKSVWKIADDLQKRVQTMNRVSAVRAARTAFTEAENAGRMDTCVEAENMGLEIEKQWLAAHDERTREAHAMADGQTVPYKEAFQVGGEALMYPGDPSGSPANIYNCRCTLVLKVVNIHKEWQKGDESYKEWLARKEKAA